MRADQNLPVGGGNRKPTVGDVGDFTQDVVPADLSVALWWTDQGLTDHGDVDFGADASTAHL